ncbi:glycosyltransferase family 4 protein [Veronia pacifica]|uniref:Glycosyl transferase family 1 domain-containing protein n=1 Tax=Veronia pacifica TaxID=1080227 RepID=A0A1C3ERB7_9GAMM|nr:glycosyltransferase family 4 protein [Veronia pacifica]ODA35770.1 hypothetical protein A8L45_01650 [Veronia pacifica]
MQLKAKKILFVFHNNDGHSGATASMLDIIKYLANQNNLTLCAVIPHKPGNLESNLRDLNVEVFIERYYSCRYGNKESSFFAKLPTLKSLLKSALTFLSAVKFHFSKNNKFDLVYSNTTDNFWGSIYSIISSIDHICHIREFGLDDQNQLQSIGNRNYYNLLNKSTVNVIAISKSISKYLVEERNIECGKIVEIYDDVGDELEDFQYRKFNSEIRLLMVGSFLEGKGQEFVIESIQLLKNQGLDIHLGLIGDDSTPYASYLKRKCSELEIEKNVHFYGFRHDVKKIRKSYNFAVIASTAEAFGRVTIEGMMSSQIVIASDTGANTELIKQNINGFLFKYGCKKSFCDTVISLANNDFDLERVQKNGFSYSKSFYRNECGKAVLKLIHS